MDIIGELKNNSHDLMSDESLVSAAIETLSTGKLTPILKEELRRQLHLKCFLEGKVLEVEQKDIAPPVRRQLLPAEIERLEKRREQNRRAAKKFRQKKSLATGKMAKAVMDLEKKNKELRSEVKQLVKDINWLKTRMSDHVYQPSLDLLSLGQLQIELGVQFSDDDENSDQT